MPLTRSMKNRNVLKKFKTATIKKENNETDASSPIKVNISQNASASGGNSKLSLQLIQIKRNFKRKVKQEVGEVETVSNEGTIKKKHGMEVEVVTNREVEMVSNEGTVDMEVAVNNKEIATGSNKRTVANGVELAKLMVRSMIDTATNVKNMDVYLSALFRKLVAEENEQSISSLQNAEEEKMVFSSNPTLEEIRQLQSQFARERDWNQYHQPRNLLLALVGEVGELAELFQWRGEVKEGLPDWTAEDKEHLGQELSDVLLYLVRLSEKCQIDLPAAVLKKIAMNGEKYPASKVKGSNKKYTHYDS